jgi:hypothetical protein
MSSEQIPLSGYKSKIVEQQNFDTINVGKPLLNEDDEYVFRLTKVPHVIKTQVVREKDGIKTTENAEKAVCDFEETSTKNIVTSFLRIDKLNFSEDDSYRSAVIRFFHKIGSPLTENKEPNWEDKFVVGMRFRGRVKVKQGEDKDRKVVIRYYLDIPTVRKLLPTDFEGAAPAVSPSGSMAFAQPPVEHSPDADRKRLLNAQIIVKGCATSSDAMMRLLDAKVGNDIIAAFVQADKNGLITYPC